MYNIAYNIIVAIKLFDIQRNCTVVYIAVIIMLCKKSNRNQKSMQEIIEIKAEINCYAEILSEIRIVEEIC